MAGVPGPTGPQGQTPNAGGPTVARLAPARQRAGEKTFGTHRNRRPEKILRTSPGARGVSIPQACPAPPRCGGCQRMAVIHSVGVLPRMKKVSDDFIHPLLRA